MPFEFEELGMGVVLIKPRVFSDVRGFFLELFKSKDFSQVGIPTPIQVNMSFSLRGVIRGLHYQLTPKEQGKIVLVPKGRILDVAVDVRKSSSTFGKHMGVELDEENHHMLWIPPASPTAFKL